MEKRFDLDSKIMTIAFRITDLFVLNILTCLCCIPIITVGTAQISMCYVLLKIVRGEEPNIYKSFFKAFKKNLKQGMFLTMIYIVVAIVVGMDFYIFSKMLITVSDFLKAILIVVMVLVLLNIKWGIILMSRYENSVFGTIKNSIIVEFLYFPYTIVIGICQLIPLIILYVCPRIEMIVFMFILSGPGFLQAYCYSRVFDKIENVKQKKERKVI